MRNCSQFAWDYEFGQCTEAGPFKAYDNYRYAGHFFSEPEHNCCACGKGRAKIFTAVTKEWDKCHHHSLDVNNDYAVQFCNIGNKHRICNHGVERAKQCHQDCGPGFEFADLIQPGYIHRKAYAVKPTVNGVESPDRYQIYTNATLTNELYKLQPLGTSCIFTEFKLWKNDSLTPYSHAQLNMV